MKLIKFVHHVVRSQAKFKSSAVAIMALLFSFTTPLGDCRGYRHIPSCEENSPTALIVRGIFNAASASIHSSVWMALVDLWAADFVSSKMQKNWRLQLRANPFLLLGAGCMSFLAERA